MRSRTLHLHGAAATEAAGARLSRCLRGGMTVTLSGDLGAGKTTFVRGVLRALGWTARVKSPTFALVEHYVFSSLYFYHIDFYRFDDPAEWDSSGLADCFRDDAVCLVEWPERVGDRLPRADVALTFAHAGPDARTLAIRANGAAGERCASALIDEASA